MQDYKYLGVHFSISGSISLTSLELYKKGLKAFYKIKSIFDHKCPNSKVALHVFDHTIKPILTYGSDIWGSCTKKSRRQTQTLDMTYRDFNAEKLHLKYCKYILGVHSRASNLATIGELGRFPIYDYICESICKFYLHVKRKDSDSCNSNTVEDEVHFLCNCPTYHNERKSFFKFIVDKTPCFRTLDDSAKLIWLMTCEDEIVINTLADFVYQCFQMRKCAITQ